MEYAIDYKALLYNWFFFLFQDRDQKDLYKEINQGQRWNSSRAAGGKSQVFGISRICFKTDYLHSM